jgi:hypothetical protein
LPAITDFRMLSFTSRARLLLLALAVPMALPGYSQSANSQGEWVRGWAKLAVQVSFQDSTSQTTRMLDARERISFGISTKSGVAIFESNTIEVSRFSDAPVVLKGNPVTIDTVSRFVERLFQSQLVELYRLMDDDSKPHYYLKKETKLTELQFGVVKLVKDGRTFNYTVDRYKNQLQALLYECPTLDVKKVTYDERSITSLLREYHKFCQADYRILFEGKGKSIFSIGVTGRKYFISPPITSFDVTLRFQLPRRFNQEFILLDLGHANDDVVDRTNGGFHFALLGGRYFGKPGHFRPFAYLGFDNATLFNLGGGVTIAKRFDLSIQRIIGVPPSSGNRFGLRATLYPFLFPK